MCNLEARANGIIEEEAVVLTSSLECDFPVILTTFLQQYGRVNEPTGICESL